MWFIFQFDLADQFLQLSMPQISLNLVEVTLVSMILRSTAKSKEDLQTCNFLG